MTLLQLPSSSFLHLCNTLQGIESQNETKEKITCLSVFLSGISAPKNLLTAIQFVGEGAFPAYSGKRISAGSRTIGLAAAIFCEIDYDLVFKPSRAATGSHSETIERLMENIPAALAKREPANLSLADVQQIYTDLLAARNRQEKTDILHSAWGKMTPLEIACFIKILKNQSPLAGLDTPDILTAIAKAFQADPAKTEYAHVMTHSLGETAILARENRLKSAQFRLFQPVPFMHASLVKRTTEADFTEYVAEEKIDGMRAQVHAKGHSVEIFDRDLNKITKYFPDITGLLSAQNLPPAVFDGVICLFKDNRIQPLPLLLKRMQFKKLPEKNLADYPALFIAYDLLYAEQTPLFRLPFMERRNILASISEEFAIPVTLQFDLSTEVDLHLFLKRSIAHGNEGLILKKRNSTYEYGKRKKSWLNLKKPDLTLDTVVMYARSESRKQGGPYSDFTLGVSVEKDSRYEEDFIPIGKIDSGYSSDDLKKINEKIQELTVERYGPTLGLKPGMIIRTAFRRVQKNNRTKAGFTLQSPLFKEIMWDLQAADIHTLTDVEELYHQRLQAERSTQRENPSFTRGGRPPNTPNRA